ncbi:NAD-dependent malic enzyme, partial [Patescibacteria group bacterium]|nr:NAD-dependent malic enzyme [Patescibacteria group bacterium]
MNYYKKSLELHAKKKGKLEIKSKLPLNNKTDLSVAYTPGVAEPCREIAKNPAEVYKYTIKGNSVAVVTNGSAVLGLGNIGAQAALPVMEGKCVLFKKFANIDAYPICLDTQSPKEIIKAVKLIAPGFG